MHPFAIAMDGSESARIEVRVMGSAVAAVAVGNAFPAVGVRIDGVEYPQTGGQIQLFDDGSHGDRVAGDGIWTRAGISAHSPPIPPLRFVEFDQLAISDSLGSRVLNLYAVGGGGSAGAVRLGLIDAALRREPTAVAEGMLATRHAVLLIDAMADLELRRFLMLRPPVSAVQSMTARFYEHFPDVYDFLILEPGAGAVRGLAGLHNPVSNAVQGIGQPLMSQAAAWGSGGRLQSVVGVNLSDGGPVLHELTHRWGNALAPALGIGQCAPGHWGIAGMGLGTIGGFDGASLIDHGAGQFSAALDRFSLAGASQDQTPMNPLELYLAGFIPASELAPFPVPVNAQCASLQYDSAANRVRFLADGVVQRTVADIVAAHGPRVPAASAAQRRFAAAWLITLDRMPTAAEAGWFEYRSRYLGQRHGDQPFRLTFAQATHGLASMQTAPLVVFAEGFEP